MNIIFAGTPEFAAVSLKAILTQTQHRVAAVYTQPDRPAGRGRKLTPSPVKQLALEHALAVYQPVSLKDSDAQQEIMAENADVMVVVAYGLILPQMVLQAPRLGCINVHASLLPRWRGAAPIQRAILAGDAQTGVTIMKMERGLDTGPMLHKVITSIEAQESAASLHDRLAVIGAHALLYVLDNLPDLTPQTQNDALATYADKLQKEEAKIDWLRSADVIERQVRAFNPWPVAQCEFNGEVVRIWEAQATERNADSAPGTVIQASKLGIEVSTGECTLNITRLQLPGKKPAAAADFLNAHSVQGMQFT